MTQTKKNILWKESGSWGGADGGIVDEWEYERVSSLAKDMDVVTSKDSKGGVEAGPRTESKQDAEMYMLSFNFWLFVRCFRIWDLNNLHCTQICHLPCWPLSLVKAKKNVDQLVNSTVVPFTILCWPKSRTSQYQTGSKWGCFCSICNTCCSSHQPHSAPAVVYRPKTNPTQRVLP